MLFGLLPACGGGGAPAGGGTPAGGGAVAPPAAGEVFKWRNQTNTNAGTALWWSETELTDLIRKASGGRLDIDTQPMGAIVGSMEMFDAVSTGAIEMASA